MLEAKVKLVRGRNYWQWVVEQCPYCGKRHEHGDGSIHRDPRENLGSRLAHCVKQSANDNPSYVLVEEAP